MAQGFPDYFGELVLPVTVPNGGTGRQSVSTGLLLVRDGTSAMNQETPKALGMGTSAPAFIQKANTGTEILSLGAISVAGLCRVSGHAFLKNASGNAISLKVTATWVQNGVSVTADMFTISSSSTGDSADGAVKAIYPDTTQQISITFTPSGFGAGDSYDLIGSLEQLP